MGSLLFIEQSRELLVGRHLSLFTDIYLPASSCYCLQWVPQWVPQWALLWVRGTRVFPLLIVTTPTPDTTPDTTTDAQEGGTQTTVR